ncbi:hypothetical protein ACWGLL_15990 [Brevundimonas sp. NPDC055814]|uniref:hypothetical protein n=1 Tax=Brevundimonas diminuta TaxID=293 RepID=UPI003208F2B0
MRSMFPISPTVCVSAGALVVTLGLAACQPSHPARPEAASEPSPAPIAAAPAAAESEVAPAPTEVGPEAPAQAAPPVAAPGTPSEEGAARPSVAPAPAPAVKVNVPAQQTPPPPPAVTPAVQPGVLPAGAGRNVAQRLCGTCHSLVLVTATGHTEAEWDSIVARMEANGMQASADDIDTVIGYLGKALPPR